MTMNITMCVGGLVPIILSILVKKTTERQEMSKEQNKIVVLSVIVTFSRTQDRKWPRNTIQKFVLVLLTIRSKLDVYAFSCVAELTWTLGEEFPEVYARQLICYDSIQLH